MKKDFAKPAFCVLISGLLFLSSCRKEKDVVLPTEPVQLNLSADQVSLVNSDNTFALDIYKKVLNSSSDADNILISPLSISSALSMTLNGAAGATRDSMLTALKLSGLTPETINASYKDLTSTLRNLDERVILNIANSVWSDKDFTVKTTFSDILKQYYDAAAMTVDMTDPQTVTMVNNWIAEKTNNLIKNMLGTLDPSTVMLLVNAIYFKGKWESQFDKANTHDGSFIKNDGAMVQVPMMRQTSGYKLFKGDGFTLAELPYGQGNFAMDVILPDDYTGIGNTLSKINNESFNTWLGQMTETQTDIVFPRFKYSYKQELRKILSDMGMSLAFSDFADFSNISDIGLKISFVLHQAFIETNEEGSEAAAATIVGIVTTAMPSEPFHLNIDHPFLYIIRETTTNTILFMGKVVNPVSD